MPDTLTTNNCPKVPSGVHEWEYLGNDDDMIDTYKCVRCKKNIYERLAPYGHHAPPGIS